MKRNIKPNGPFLKKIVKLDAEDPLFTTKIFKYIIEFKWFLFLNLLNNNILIIISYFRNLYARKFFFQDFIWFFALFVGYCITNLILLEYIFYEQTIKI